MYIHEERMKAEQLYIMTSCDESEVISTLWSYKRRENTA